MNRRAVLLDAGGTLFTERLTRDELYRSALAAHGIGVPLATLARLRAEVHDAMPEVFEGRRRYTDPWFDEFMRRLLVRLEVDLSPAELRAELGEVFSRPETFVVFAEVPDALESLAERGLRLAVASNWSDRLTGLLEGLGLLRHFEVVAISAVVGHTKPDPGLFRWTLERLGLRPDQAVHVGDHPLNDLAGARRAGLAAWRVDRHRPPGAPPEPDTIGGLDEILERLD